MFEVRLQNTDPTKLISADDLRPCELAEVVDKRYPEHNGCIVMRSPETSRFVLINLSKAGPDKCWTDRCGLFVRKLNPGEIIIMEVK